MLLPLNIKDSEFIENLKNGEIVIDNSTFIQLDSCFAQGIMGAVLKKQPTYGSIHLDFGSCIHAAMECKFKGGNLVEQIEAAKADESWPKVAESTHALKTQDKSIEVLKDYDIHTRISQNFDVLQVDNKPLCEESFRLKLGEFELDEQKEMELFSQLGMTNEEKPSKITIYWQGKIDLLVAYQGMPMICDHKTTSVMGEKFAETFLRSSQMIGYYWAAHTLVELGMGELTDERGRVYNLKEKPFRGVLINAIAIRESGIEFKLFDIPIPLTRIEEWRLGTVLRLKYFTEQLSDYLQSNMTAPNREHCVTKYGRCPFFDVCEAPDHMRAAMLDSSSYYTSDWSPLK